MDVDTPPSLPSAEPPPLCKLCGNSPPSPETTSLPICEPCRLGLVRRPLPAWVKAAAALSVLIVLAAFIRFPAAAKAGVHFERGVRWERADDFGKAVQEYEVARANRPASVKIGVRLAYVAFKSGDVRKSVEVMNSLAGSKVDKDEARDAHWLEQQFDATIKKARETSETP